MTEATDELYSALCEDSCDWNATPVVSVDRADAYARRYASAVLAQFAADNYLMDGRYLQLLADAADALLAQLDKGES